MSGQGDQQFDVPTINRELRDIWNGVTHDLMEAEESQNLSWEIGQNSKEINDSTFGRFLAQCNISAVNILIWQLVVCTKRVPAGM